MRKALLTTVTLLAMAGLLLGQSLIIPEEADRER
jgi:hypothetical protein